MKNSIIKEVRKDGVHILNYEKLTYIGDLYPKYSRQQSFYKKAKLYKDLAGKIYLMSYDTIVAVLEDALLSPSNQIKIYIKGWFSKTTSIHINEFLQQQGFNPLTKKQMNTLSENNKYIIL